MTTTIQSSITFDRDTRDFEVTVDLQVVGWRGTRAEAESLLNETVTRRLQQRADAADAAAVAAAAAAHEATTDTPACRTCGGPVEIGGDECDDCAALCCEACGASVDAESAHLLGDRMVCGACAAHQAEHVAYMAALAAADERRAYREALAEAGCAADEAQRLSQFLRQQEDKAHDDEPFSCPCCGLDYQAFIGGRFRCIICGTDITDAVRQHAAAMPELVRTCAAEDRASRGGW